MDSNVRNVKIQVELTDRFESGRRFYRLTSPISVTWPTAREHGGIDVYVPSGFETDFASIPKFAHCVYSPDGQWALASIVHDYYYSENSSCGRFLADAIFMDLMEQLEVPRWRRTIIYLAVRLFGWKYFKGSGYLSRSMVYHPGNNQSP